MKKLIIGMLLILSTFTFASGSQYKDYKNIKMACIWNATEATDKLIEIQNKGWNIIEIIDKNNGNCSSTIIIVYGTLKEE